tara:strand:- start:3577 stop:3831 length:255 start_codon:yes stop_codon:yes gene_type:complete
MKAEHKRLIKNAEMLAERQRIKEAQSGGLTGEQKQSVHDMLRDIFNGAESICGEDEILREASVYKANEIIKLAEEIAELEDVET